MPSIPLTHLAATWERCAVAVQGQILEPMPPFTPYNLFDFYFPAGRAPERDQRSLHYEFLRVDASNREAVVDFCERFGVLRILAEGRGPDILDAMADESDPADLARYPRGVWRAHDWLGTVIRPPLRGATERCPLRNSETRKLSCAGRSPGRRPANRLHLATRRAKRASMCANW